MNKTKTFVLAAGLGVTLAVTSMGPAAACDSSAPMIAKQAKAPTAKPVPVAKDNQNCTNSIRTQDIKQVTDRRRGPNPEIIVIQVNICGNSVDNGNSVGNRGSRNDGGGGNNAGAGNGNAARTN